MSHWEQLVETAVQPQEVMWAALRALVPTVCQGVALTVGQGEHAWHRMQAAAPETLVVAASRGWAFTHTSGLQIRRSFQGGMRVMIPIRAEQCVLGTLDLLFAPGEGLSRQDLWTVERLGVVLAEALLLSDCPGLMVDPWIP